MTPAPEDADTTTEPADSGVTVTVEDGLYIATDDETGISSQGPTEEAARANLEHALESHADATAEDDSGWL